MNRYSLAKRCLAEALGTAWLVLMGVGTAVISGAIPWVGVTGVAIAFGLSLLTAAYTFGSISGCHINPAVTIGFWVAKQFSSKDVLPYIGSQILGGIWGSTILFLICMGKPEFTTANFGSNGVGIHSPGNYSWWACALAEFIVTCGFVLLILSVTSSPVFKRSAPIPIGLGLILVHLILIPVTNASVNPVRSLATAVFTRGWALADLWIFIVFPIFGGVLAGIIARSLQEPDI
ncbi:MAG: aquaporin Z [Nostoc sp.]|uniref:aquaporin Z n=1 Tax=Nostoc sp. TaxID=1180 RepID=UPI002FFA7FAD